MNESLKCLALNLNVSSVKHRIKLYNDFIENHKKDPALTDNVLKQLLSKIIPPCLILYEDQASRNLLAKLMKTFAEFYPKWTLEYLPLTFNHLVKQVTQPNPNRGVNRSCLFAIYLICDTFHALPTTFQLEEATCSDLLISLSKLVTGCFTVNRQVLRNGLQKKLHSLFNKKVTILDMLCSILSDASPDFSHVCMLSIICNYLRQSEQMDKLNTHKEAFLQHLLKTAFVTKQPPSETILRGSKWLLLATVTHDNFKPTVVPILHRAILRSPEVAMKAVAIVLTNLSIDLNRYAEELMQPIATQLLSKSESVRSDAQLACLSIASQCSSWEVVLSLVQQVNRLLRGNEGKVTANELKAVLINTIGDMASCGVSKSTNSWRELAEAITKMIADYIKSENHDGSIQLALSQLSKWLSNFSASVPESVVNWLQSEGFNQKNASNVRIEFISCMVQTFNKSELLYNMPKSMQDNLFEVLKRSLKQLNLTNLLVEGLCASCLLVKFAAIDRGTTISQENDQAVRNRYEPLWTFLFGSKESKGSAIFNPKFLINLQEQYLCYVIMLGENLLVDHADQLTEENTQVLYKSLLHCLSHPNFSVVRDPARRSVSRLVSGLSGLDMTKKLLKAFTENYLPQISSQLSQSRSTLDSSTEISPESKTTNPRFMCDCLLSLFCNKTFHGVDDNDPLKVDLALSAVYPANHPLLHNEEPILWRKILKRMNYNDTYFVDECFDKIIESFLAMESMDEMHYNALVCLVRNNPNSFCPGIQFHILPLLSRNEIVNTSYHELGILMTPEGVLFNKQLIESLPKYKESTANIKRESKLYSYKEQMAEMELRKELEKKKKGGKQKDEPPQLTKKQQEMVDEKLAEESEIRKRVGQLDSQIFHLCRMLEAAEAGNSFKMADFLPEIVPCLVKLLRSPVPSRHALHLLTVYSRCAFPPDMEDIYHLCYGFHSMIAHWMVRIVTEFMADDAEEEVEELLKTLSECSDHSKWCVESLESQSERVLNMIHSCVVVQNQPISNLSFCFIFPSLLCVLERWCDLLQLSHSSSDMNGESAKAAKWCWINQDIARQILFIIDRQSKQRNPSGCCEAMGVDPANLPHSELFLILSKLIKSNERQPLQSLCESVMLEVAKSISGEELCACPYENDVEVLISTLKSDSRYVRVTTLKSLLYMLEGLKFIVTHNQINDFTLRIWVSRFDNEKDCSDMAKKLWSELSLTVRPDLCISILDDVAHKLEPVRLAAGEAMAALLDEHPDQMSSTLGALFAKHNEKLHIPLPIVDDFNRVIVPSPPDQWQSRCGLAFALGKLCERVSEEHVPAIFHFMVPGALNDRSEMVRDEMLKTALKLIERFGHQQLNVLLPIMEKFLNEAPNTAEFDAVRRSIIILTGSLAKHLDQSNPKVTTIFSKLVESLSFPSQPVQEAVANCMTPLIGYLSPDDQSRIIQKMMTVLLESSNYADRKGAAYGLAGIVKGLGILALKQHNIMDQLIEAVNTKKEIRYKEGALLAFSTMCLTLGRLFEPYVVKIIPHLLTSFGDGNSHVRAAADEAAKSVMSKLSAHGVKLVLPSLLEALKENSWRTKAGSVELLGAMAYCAPKQLSACLPQIVPKLMEVLTDSHMKVQSAGEHALREIGKVIKNPEIQALVPILMESLINPLNKTTTGLQALLDTEFVHFIDAPSLALIMPVVERAFKDRSTETRKKACQIIGNMYSLTDNKDLQPYMETMLPGLKTSLLDPEPEVRGVAARALGAMVKGMGEPCFKDLAPWLMMTLTSEASSVDRSGAAQGLAEAVGGIGKSRLDALMPDIIEMASRTDIQPHVRDGYIMLYIYLPAVFEDDFSSYVGPVLPSILKALSDENEFVRETALRAGNRIVQLFSEKAIELLLPELEEGLLHENWRIRLSSVQLLGDLLCKLSGVSGKGTTEGGDDDATFGTETSQQVLTDWLGKDRRDRVLSRLYMSRSDISVMVRQAANHLWKLVVANTGRTLREIMPTLFRLLLGCLGASSEDKRQVSARTLGDMVKKIGERVLPEILPILEAGLDSDDSDQRQGVCIGLCEIMKNCSKDQVANYAENLLPSVKRALYDPLPGVRQCAAQTFDELHNNIGQRALEDVLPDLLSKLENEDLKERALNGLREVLAVKSRFVMPYLVPQLSTPGVNTRVFSLLAAVSGDALSKHLTKLMPALFKAMNAALDTDKENEEVEYCTKILLAITDEFGVRGVLQYLTSVTQHEKDSDRITCCLLLNNYLKNADNDEVEEQLAEAYPQIIRMALKQFTSANQRVLVSAWSLVDCMVKKWGSESVDYANDIRQAVRSALMDQRTQMGPGAKPEVLLSGFCMKGYGVAPFLDVYREAILNGKPDVKEVAALGLGECIAATSTEALSRSAIKIAGPLIRVMGDRYNHNIKAPIIEALGLLLVKCSVSMKPFVAQLQATFEKALSDPNRVIRLRAAAAMGNLSSITDKIDKLLSDLYNKECANESEFRDSSLHTLRCCVAGGGGRIKPETFQLLVQGLSPLLDHQSESTRIQGSACLGALFGAVTIDEYCDILLALFKGVSNADWTSKHGRAIMIMAAVKGCPGKFLHPDKANSNLTNKIITLLHDFCSSDKVNLCLAGLRALGFAIGYMAAENLTAMLSTSLPMLAKCMKNESSEVKLLTAQVCAYVVLHNANSSLNVGSYARGMIPVLLNGTREKNSAVRNSSETALALVSGVRPGKEYKELVQYQHCLNSLDEGMRGPFTEILAKLAKKSQPMDTSCPELDDSILK